LDIYRFQIDWLLAFNFRAEQRFVSA
jgi:hypothetical protein